MFSFITFSYRSYNYARLVFFRQLNHLYLYIHFDSLFILLPSYFFFSSFRFFFFFFFYFVTKKSNRTLCSTFVQFESSIVAPFGDNYASKRSCCHLLSGSLPNAHRCDELLYGRWQSTLGYILILYILSRLSIIWCNKYSRQDEYVCREKKISFGITNELVDEGRNGQKKSKSINVDGKG